MKILILVLFLTSCGKFQDFVQNNEKGTRKQSDATFDSLKNKFATLVGKKVNVPITFANLEYPKAGVCYIYSDGYREVNVDRKSWDSFSSEQREQLIFHELGHCVLNKGHDNSILDAFCPKSIMRSYMFNLNEIDDCYKPNYDHYIQNLIGG